MTLFLRVLLILIFLEAIATVFVVGKKLRSTKPSMPDMSYLDPYTIEELTQLAREAETGTAENWRELGQALLGEGYYCHAEQCYRQIVKMNPDDYEAEFHVAFCLDRTGRLEEAIPLFQNIAAKSDALTRSSSYFFLARAFLRQKKPEEAVQAAASAKSIHSANFLAAKALHRQGQVDQAKQMVTAALEETPNSIKLLQLKAVLQELSGETTEALVTRDLVQRAEYKVSLNPNTGFIDQYNKRYGFARELEDFNDLTDPKTQEQSEKLLAEFMETAGSTDDHIKRLLLKSEANLGFYQKDPQKTLAAIEQLREIGENRAEISELEGNAYKQLGKMDLAEQAWLRAVTMNPSVTLHEQLAELYAQLKRQKKQAYHASQAATLRGHAAFHENKFASAKSEFQIAVQQDTANSLAWFYLGEIERYYGNQADASRNYEQCLHIEPTFGRALSGLERLNNKTTAVPDNS